MIIHQGTSQQLGCYEEYRLTGVVVLKRLVCLSKPFLLGLSVLLASSPKKEIERQKDFGKGIEIAKEEGKPVLIHFWQPSCSQCQLMDREVWPNPEVVSQSEKFVSIPVNIQQSRRLLSKYKVRGTPVDVFADPWGNPIFRVLGGMSAEALVMMMKSFLGSQEVAGNPGREEQEPGGAQERCQILPQAGPWYCRPKTGAASRFV